MIKNYLIFLFLFIISCVESPKIRLVNTNKSINPEDVKIKEEVMINIIEKKNVTDINYASLFYDKSFFIKKSSNATNTAKKEIINPDDYKVVIEWQVPNGQRKIKLKNFKTNEEFVVTEGDKKGKVILVQKNLFYYIFNINGITIKVKR